MSRILEQTFIEKGSSYGSGTQANVLDLRYGAQNGWSPDWRTYTNSTPHVSSPLICVLLEPPLAFNYFKEPDKWIGALKALVETKARRIEGLSNRLEVTTDAIPFGGGGQEFEVPTDVKESKPNISFTWTDVYGMPIFRFFKAWINYFIMNPHTKYATGLTENFNLTDLLPDQYSCTMAFIEPDRAHKNVIQSWIVTNMFPKSTGDNNAKRDKESPQEVKELNIEFAGLSQQGEGVNEFSQILLDSFKLGGANPDKQRSMVNEVSARVKALKFGYGNSVDNVAKQQVNY